MLFSSLVQYTDLALLLLRISIGAIFIFHSIPKMMKTKMMAEMMGMGSMSMLVKALGIVELVFGLGLILGIYTQLSALILAIIMVGATFMKIFVWHFPFSAMDKMGWEIDIILLSANLVILTVGPGMITVLS